MTSALSTFGEAALAYARRGWAVFPLKPRDKIPMIGPTRPGGHDGGFHLASKDEAQIRAWWAKWPNANIGLRCGEESGVFVLDLDGADAEIALERLVETHGALPETLQQKTGKGRHLLFTHVAGVRNRGGGYLIDGKRTPCPGFDVRGEGGYIVLPPSVHPNGRVYAWKRHCMCADPADCVCQESAAPLPVAAAPQWLIDAIVPPAKPAAAPASSYADRFRDGRATKYGEAALDSSARRIALAQPGTRHTTLSFEAVSIGELVAGGEIERAYAERVLVSAATAMMAGAITPRELSKIDWGLQTGASRPRKVTRDQSARRHDAETAAHVVRRDDPVAAARPVGWLAVQPQTDAATMIVAPESIAEAAAAAWERAYGGEYGLFVVRDLDALSGGLAPNAGGYDDWRLPRANLSAPAVTMRWRGAVLIVLPAGLRGFTISGNTKWEKFISGERYGQVLALLATHWWKAAGARDVQIAVLPDEDGGSSEQV